MDPEQMALQMLEQIAINLARIADSLDNIENLAEAESNNANVPTSDRNSR